MKDWSSSEITKLLGCPHCLFGEVTPIIHCESTLMARNNKMQFWVNCLECNKVSFITYYSPSDIPKISTEKLQFDIFEFIKDCNENLPTDLKDKGVEFKVEDYIKNKK